MVNKKLSSKLICFSNTIPCELFHTSFIGLLFVSFLFPSTFQIEEAFGTSIFLLLETNPLSIKYPSVIFLGLKSVTFSSLFNSALYSLKVRSSIAAPLSEIDQQRYHFQI